MDSLGKEMFKAIGILLFGFYFSDFICDVIFDYFNTKSRRRRD